MTREGEQLTMVVIDVINSRRDAIQINPAWIATEAIKRLDTIDVQTLTPLIYMGCHLQLRQIARAQCRGLFESDSGDIAPAQHEMFPDLQWRYPAARSVPGEEPTYVLLEAMTDNDVAYNVSRLRNEANAKLKHADALEYWNINRLKSA